MTTTEHAARKPLPVDANVRVLLVAALLKSGGSLALLHEELGEAAIASFSGVLTIENEYEGAVIRFERSPEEVPSDV